MPKLKVPSESLKTKDRPVNADGSSRKRHLSKEHGSQALVVETKPKFNGYPQRNGFHDIYGQSDDEVSQINSQYLKHRYTNHCFTI